MFSDRKESDSTNDDIWELKKIEKTYAEGEVRIRSNICDNPNDSYLIPGDVLKGYGMSLNNMTQRQRDEMMYYEPCSYCKRTIYKILEEGCDRPVCRKQGIPSSAEASLRKQSCIDDPNL